MARTYYPFVPAKTCSINIRLSREAQDENLSKDGMLDDCLALAAAHGLTVVNVHIDDGYSGAIRNRKGFVDWLDDARECRVDHLLAWHVDRMTREGINVAGMILDTVEGKDPETGKQVRHPVRLLDTKGLDSAGDETSFRFQFVIKAEVARAERERMRDRARNAHRRVLEAGRWPGGPIPYGFDSVDNPHGPGKVVQIHPKEAALIREAAERILAGETLLSVVRWANGPDGLPPRRAKHWVRRTLMQVLTGHPVRGQVVKLVDNKPVPVVDAAGNPVAVPAILTPDESAAIRAKLAPTPDSRKGGRKPARLLSGILRCQSCGGKMQVARRTDGSVTYRCQVASESARCPRPVSIAAPPVEEYIADHFLGRWGATPEFVRRAQVTGAAEIEAAEEAVTAALNALSQEATADHFAALQAAQARRAAALELPRESQVILVSTGRTIAEAWAATEADEVDDAAKAAKTADRRELIATNYAEIIVKPVGLKTNYFQPSRLDIVMQPPHALGNLDDAWRRGATVV